jgi:hypothetical protein
MKTHSRCKIFLFLHWNPIRILHNAT